MGGKTGRSAALLGLAAALSGAPACAQPEAAGRPDRVVHLRDFGARCDGRSDDTAAMAAWLARAAPQTVLEAPAGTCVFTAPLSAPAGGIRGVTVRGSGPYTTVFRYAGPPDAGDLLTIGDGARPYIGWLLEGFTLTSTTRMSSGAGLHLRNLDRSALRDVIIDGQDGTGDLWTGVWFDRIDEVFYDHFQARAQRDAVAVNGAVGVGPKAGLFLSNCKISMSGVGVHMGGAFGGLAVQQCDVIDNGINLVVDTALAAEQNREVIFGDTSNLDTATAGPAVLIDDPLSGSLTAQFAGWIATGPGPGIEIRAAHGAKISISAPVIWNFGGDGVRIEDPTAFVAIAGHTLIHDNRGYGVGCAAPVRFLISAAQPFANARGAYAPECGR